VGIDKNQVLKEVKPLFADINRYSETAEADLFLQCYAETQDFIAISGDGIIRNYTEFKKICKEYYGSLSKQKITTTHEIYHVLDDNTVVLSWSGHIEAFFKNGDFMKMENYAVTFLFNKKAGQWKVIHTHESTLPPEILKSK